MDYYYSMYKTIIAIVLWWIVAIMWGKLLLANNYQYNKYTWGVFLDEAFPQAQAEYDRKVASGEYIRLVDYSSTGTITVRKEINKQEAKKPTKTSQKNATYNIDKLAECVAIAETSWCTTWMWRTKNNCFWIMIRPKKLVNWKRIRVRTWKSYASKEQSFEHFKQIWSKSYWRYPDYKLAKKRTGGDNTQRWLNTVNSCYYK